MNTRTNRAEANSQVPTAAEINLVLDYILAHKMNFVQEFLRERNLYFSGTKETLRKRLQAYLNEGQLSITDLVRLLNEIEGWGNQHIYLYKAPGRLMEPWLEEGSVRQHLARLELINLLTRPRPLVLPDKPTLSAIEWTAERVRFVWVEQRKWEERVTEDDFEEHGMVWHAYRVSISRGLVAFDWDLVSGYAMWMIQQLPRGTRYHQVRERFAREFQPIVDLNDLHPIHVSRAIRPIEASREVRRRQLAYQTWQGSKATFTSASRSRDAFEDPHVQRAGQALQEDTAGLLANFYWLPVEGKLEHELHCKIYAADQHVGFFGEHQEQEVRYVLSRILHYSRETSGNR
jgi:hypothetical protein